MRGFYRYPPESILVTGITPAHQYTMSLLA